MLTELSGNNIAAKIILDSVAPTGRRLTTWELTYPRFVHAEFMTHRVFSRNAASSRAIPVKKMIQNIKDTPALPVYWGKNQAGMQAAEELEGEHKLDAIKDWLEHRDDSIEVVERLVDRYNLHKQIANRLLEPWMRITVICTATQFGNFFNLRCHKDAQPEIKYLADLMQRLYFSHKPTELLGGEWHCPMMREDDDKEIWLYLQKQGGHEGHFDWHPSYKQIDEIKKKISVARCARVSYLTHDGRKDFDEDIKLHDRLAASGHWSPFEHVAMATCSHRWSGNFLGFKQYRKEFKAENNSIFYPNLPDLEDAC